MTQWAAKSWKIKSNKYFEFMYHQFDQMLHVALSQKFQRCSDDYEFWQEIADISLSLLIVSSQRNFLTFFDHLFVVCKVLDSFFLSSLGILCNWENLIKTLYCMIKVIFLKTHFSKNFSKNPMLSCFVAVTNIST